MADGDSFRAPGGAGMTTGPFAAGALPDRLRRTAGTEHQRAHRAGTGAGLGSVPGADPGRGTLAGTGHTPAGPAHRPSGTQRVRSARSARPVAARATRCWSRRPPATPLTSSRRGSATRSLSAWSTRRSPAACRSPCWRPSGMIRPIRPSRIRPPHSAAPGSSCCCRPAADPAGRSALTARRNSRGSSGLAALPDPPGGMTPPRAAPPSCDGWKAVLDGLRGSE